MPKPRSSSRSSHRRQDGVSLVEALVSTGVLATLLGTVAPGFVDQVGRLRLESAAAQLETDMMMARGEAVLRAQSVRLSFHRDALGSCYLIHTGGAAECRCDSGGASLCRGDAQAIKVVAHRLEDRLDLRSNSPSMLIDAVGGTVTPTGTVQWRAQHGHLNQVVNIMGRMRSCSPDGSVPGQPRC